jgi:hypothetical protein
MNDTAIFIFDGKTYEVDVDGVNCHKKMLTRLPDGTLVQLDFPTNSLAPDATQVDANSISAGPVRDARAYARIIEFPAFGQRYAVTVPEDAQRLDRSLGRLPDGRYVILHSPIEIIDAPFEHIVSPDEPLFDEAKEMNRIYEALQIS